MHNPKQESAAHLYPGEASNDVLEKSHKAKKSTSIPDQAAFVFKTAFESEYESIDKEFLCAWSIELIMMGNTLK